MCMRLFRDRELAELKNKLQAASESNLGLPWPAIWAPSSQVNGKTWEVD